MSQRVFISGWAMSGCQYADFPALIAGLEAGKLVTSVPWFSQQQEWETLRLSHNPHVVAPGKETQLPIDRLEGVLTTALEQAMLPVSMLAGPRVRVFLVGHGVRPDMDNFSCWIHRNDAEELQFFPSIKQLHANSYGQDILCSKLAHKLDLHWPPTSLYNTSNSSLAAIHAARLCIASGQADRVLVIGWVETVAQDIAFLGGQGMLGQGVSQPFSQTDSSVLLANGVVAMVLESESSLRQRDIQPKILLSGSAYRQGSSSGSFTAEFRTITQTLQAALTESGIEADEVSAALPHGNGVIASDKAEAMALNKLWGPQGIPVVSYKGQLGYLSTCNGVVDVMIAADALSQRRLLPFVVRSPLDEGLHLRLLGGGEALPLTGRHILKSGVGLDGSVVAMVISVLPEVDDD